MFNRISNCVRDWINRTEPPCDQQQAVSSINNPLNALSLQPENETKINPDQNGDHDGSILEGRGNSENLQDAKTEINRGTNLIQNEKGDEKHVEIVVKVKKERNGRAIFAVRPEAEDCSFGLKTGLCELGMNCKSNHCPTRKPEVGKVNGKEETLDVAAQGGRERDDSNTKNIVCKSFNCPGRYDSGKASSCSHKTSLTVEFNFMGLPIRPGENDCDYYMQHGSCKFGENCMFNHPDPTSVGGSASQSGHGNEGFILSPDTPQSTQGYSSPAALGESPPFVPLMFPPTFGSLPPAASSQCPPYAPSMFPPTPAVPFRPEWHVYQAPAYLPERSMEMASGYASSSRPLEKNVYTHQQNQMLINQSPERPGQPECRNFLNTGNCIHGPACRFHHPEIRSAKSTSSGHNVSGLPEQASVTLASADPALVGNCSPMSNEDVSKITSENQSLWCEVCKISFKSFAALNCHGNGKKHKKNLENSQNMKTDPTKPPLTSSSPEDFKMQKSKERAIATLADPNQSLWCEVCKMSFKSFAALNCHGYGKKHKKNLENSQKMKTDPTKPPLTSSSPKDLKMQKGKERAIATLADPNPTSATNPEPKYSVETTKKTNAHPARCKFCDVTCTSIEDLNHHKQGKKHKANVEKSKKKHKDRSQSVSTNCRATDFKVAKEKRVLEHGAPAGGRRTCVACNVVCNSQKAFDSHLAGQKHAAIVKQIIGALEAESFS